MMCRTIFRSSFPGGRDCSDDEEEGGKPPSFHIQPRKARKLSSCPEP